MAKKILLSSIIVIFFISGYTLFYHDPLPANSSIALELSKHSEQLDSIEIGKLPYEMRTIKIATGGFPPCFAVAHCHPANISTSFRSFQLRYSNGDTVIIDLVHDKAFHESPPFLNDDYSEENFQTMLKHASEASKVIISHEHFDHIQGLTELSNKHDLANIYLSDKQINNPDNEKLGLTPEILKRVNILPEKIQEIMPGIIAIPIAGHTPGNFIYLIKLQSGQKFLFASDIVWSGYNLEYQSGKPYWASLLAKENSSAVNQQIRFLLEQLPYLDVNIIIPHDEKLTKIYIDNHVIKEGF